MSFGNTSWLYPKSFSSPSSAICPLDWLRNSKPESRSSPSAADEVDDACAKQMRQSLSLLRPVTNGGSIADAATLTASVRRTRAQLARQFEQAIFISFALVTVFARHRLLAVQLSILPMRRHYSIGHFDR
jgi:hypothetical protein